MLPPSKYPEPRRQALFFHEVMDRIASLPGVECAGGADSAPMLTNETGPVSLVSIGAESAPPAHSTPGSDAMRSITSWKNRAWRRGSGYLEGGSITKAVRRSEERRVVVGSQSICARSGMCRRTRLVVVADKRMLTRFGGDCSPRVCSSGTFHSGKRCYAVHHFVEE